MNLPIRTSYAVDKSYALSLCRPAAWILWHSVSNSPLPRIGQMDNGRPFNLTISSFPQAVNLPIVLSCIFVSIWNRPTFKLLDLNSDALQTCWSAGLRDKWDCAEPMMIKARRWNNSLQNITEKVILFSTVWKSHFMQWKIESVIANRWLKGNASLSASVVPSSPIYNVWSHWAMCILCPLFGPEDICAQPDGSKRLWLTEGSEVTREGS